MPGLIAESAVEPPPINLLRAFVSTWEAMPGGPHDPTRLSTLQLYVNALGPDVLSTMRELIGVVDVLNTQLAELDELI